MTEGIILIGNLELAWCQQIETNSLRQQCLREVEQKNSSI